MDELHTSHAGIVRMKSLAWIHVWWPSIDKDIEQLAHTAVRYAKACRTNLHLFFFTHGQGQHNLGTVYIWVLYECYVFGSGGCPLQMG